MSKERRWLREAIRLQLIPQLVERGFELGPFPTSKLGSPDREFLVSFPFGRLRRRVAAGFEQIEIQLAPYNAAAFRLNLGVVPAGGVEGVLGHIAAEDAGVHSLPEYFALYSCPRFSLNFAVRCWWWSRRERTEDDYRALVAYVVGLLPEVDQALGDGKIGPHIGHTVE
jgi:hypothetical protein